jgi:hypothetical protein
MKRGGMRSKNGRFSEFTTGQHSTRERVRPSRSEWKKADNLATPTYFKRTAVVSPKMKSGVCSRCRTRSLFTNDYDDEFTCVVCGGVN